MTDTSIEREFAGETRRFHLPPANPHRLYRGLEAEGSSLEELVRLGQAGRLGSARVERILVHALSRGHPLTLLRMQELVRAEMAVRPLAEFLGLAADILAAAYAGVETE